MKLLNDVKSRLLWIPLLLKTITLIFYISSLSSANVVHANSSPKALTASDSIISLIKSFEKLRLNPYRGASGKWVVGYGHLLGQQHNGAITEQQADRYLRDDLKYAESAIGRLVKVTLLQHEYDALVSLVYNIGIGAFAKSTVLKRLNRGDKQGAADAFLMWNRAGGKKNRHLVDRREQERRFFLNSI